MNGWAQGVLVAAVVILTMTIVASYVQELGARRRAVAESSRGTALAGLVLLVVLTAADRLTHR